MNGNRARLGTRLLLIASVALVLLPVVYQLGLSLRPDQLMFSHSLVPLSLPFTLCHYREVLSALPLGRYTINSLLFATGVTGGQLLLAVPAAYLFRVLAS